MRLSLWILAAAAAIAFAPSARADDPFAYIPADAGVVVRLSPRDKIESRINEFLAGVGPAAGTSASFLDETYRNLFTGGSSSAVKAYDSSSPVYVALFAFKDDEGRPVSPAPRAIYFKSTSLDDVKKQLAELDDVKDVPVLKRDDGFEEVEARGGSVYLAQRGGWTIMAVNEISLGALNLKIGEREPLTTADPAALKMLADSEVGVYINAKKLWIVFEREIKKSEENALKAIADMPEQAFGAPDSAASAKAIYTNVAKSLFAVGADAAWVGLNVGVDGSGVNLEKFVNLPADSKTAKFLATQEPSDMALLDRLPEAAAFYFGLKIDYSVLKPEDLVKLVPGGEDYKQRFLDSWKTVKTAGIGTTVASTSLPTDEKTGFLTTQYQEATDPGKLIAAARALFGGEKTKITTNGVEIDASLTPDAEKYQGHSIDVTNMDIKFNLPADQPAAQMVQPIMKQIYGGDAYQTRVALVDKVVVQTGGNSPTVMQNAIDVFKSGERSLGRQAAYGKTRERMVNEANIIALVDLPKVIVDAVKMVRRTPAGAALGQLPFNFDRQPAASYTGFGATVEKTGIRTRLFVPVEHPREIMAIFSPAR